MIMSSVAIYSRVSSPVVLRFVLSTSVVIGAALAGPAIRAVLLNRRGSGLVPVRGGMAAGHVPTSLAIRWPLIAAPRRLR